MSGTVQVLLKDFQKKKIKKAMKEGNNVKIRIERNHLDGPDTLIVNNEMLYKIDLIRTKGKDKDITITRDNLVAMKEGGFLQFLIPAAIGLFSSLIGGKGMNDDVISPKMKEYFASLQPKVYDNEPGAWNRNNIKSNPNGGTIGPDMDWIEKILTTRGNGLYLKRGGSMYDATNTVEGSGFLSAILKILPVILKKVLPALGIGALTGVASEGASQVIKKIVGKKGNGLYMKHGGQMYDVTDTTEGNGILGKLLGLPGGKIPLLGDIPILGSIF